MKLGHYVVIQRGRRFLPGRKVCRLFFRSALDRKTYELLKDSDDAHLVRTAGGNWTYYVTDDLYREICESAFNKNDKNER